MEICHQLIRRAGRFDILQVQLPRDPPVVFICLEGVENIHPGRQVTFQIAHPETDGIQRVMSIAEAQLQVLCIRAYRARIDHLDIVRGEDRFRIPVSGGL